MYQISELARRVGLSRTTLLYYEKQGLLSGQRGANGYRIYSERDAQQLLLMKQLQAGGLTLQECKSCLEKGLNPELLKTRLQKLDAEIATKQQARNLLAALLGRDSLRSWHQATEQLAPEAFLDWLQHQGLSEKQALHLKWLSRDMNEHEQYMADFMTVFKTLDRWGPGSDVDSLRALTALPIAPQKIIDIGCGKGFSTLLLARETDADITAVDNEQSALDDLAHKLADTQLDRRVTLQCASMTALPNEKSTFDLIWSEAAAYIMGFSKALLEWKPLLNDTGYMVISDLVWLTDSPGQAVTEFWSQEYPDMVTVSTRLRHIADAGLTLIDHFTISDQAWHDYYIPLKQRIKQLKPTMSDSTALADIEREISVYENYLGEFGYEMFIMKK